MNRISLLIALAIASAARPADPIIPRLGEVTARPDYKHGRWGILVVDAETGDVLHTQNADQMFVPASTTKLYSCAAALAELGPDHRFVTRVVTRGPVEDGRLRGDLILVASGDLTLGGRTRPDGTIAFTNSDHTYAESTSVTAAVTDTDPIAGLSELATRVLAAGINRIDGDVLVDDRLFDTAQGSGSGPRQISPIIVNDNVIDFVIRAGEDGVVVTPRPETQYLQIDTQVQVRPGSKPDVTVETVGPRRVLLRGHVPPDGKRYVRIWPVDDPAAFARCVFIERLRAAGVAVAASPIGDPRSKLPGPDEVAAARTVAAFVSQPLPEAIKVTLKVSHNLYASTLPLLVAAKHGKRTMADGMRLQSRFLKGLGLDVNAVSFAGGAGGSPADSTTPRATVELLRRLRNQSFFAALEDGLPVLGVDGTLSDVVGESSPARGQVRGKTGTLVWTDFLNGRTLLRSKALAGTIVTRGGRKLIFALFVNDVPLPAGVTSSREGKALGQICEILYDEAGR